jgi:hypothetical protein
MEGAAMVLAWGDRRSDQMKDLIEELEGIEEEFAGIARRM